LVLSFQVFLHFIGMGKAIGYGSVDLLQGQRRVLLEDGLGGVSLMESRE
jgi:hypothetical protein